MFQERRKPFRFNFTDDVEDETREENESEIQIVEMSNSSCAAKRKRPVWWSKMNPDDILDEEPKKLVNFVSPGESYFESPDSSEKYEKDNIHTKQKAVRDVSGRKVKLVPSFSSWEPEFASLYVQFENGLPSNPIIRSLHPDIINVSRPKWAVKRGGCLVEFKTPELAVEALNDIEEKTVQGHSVKVDLLYHITNKKSHSKSSFEKMMKEDRRLQNGGSIEEELEEERETDISGLDEGPAFEVDYDIVRELGLKFIPEPPNEKENPEVKLVKDMKSLKQTSSDQKRESESSQIQQGKHAIPFAVPTDLKGRPESTKMKSVEKAGDLKEEVKQSKKKKKKQRKSDQKIELGEANNSIIEANVLMQQSSALKPETSKTDKQQGLKRKLVVEKTEIKSTRERRSPDSRIQIKNTNTKQGKKTKTSKKYLSDQEENSESMEVKPKEEINDLMQRSPDLKAETKNTKIYKSKEEEDLEEKVAAQKWRTQNLDSGKIKKKRKCESMSGSIVVDSKRKTLENERNDKEKDSENIKNKTKKKKNDSKGKLT